MTDQSPPNPTEPPSNSSDTGGDLLSQSNQPNDPHAWHISNRSIALTTPSWRVEQSTRTHPTSNSPHTFFRVLDEDFVHIIALTTNHQLILIREFHHGIEQPMLTLPGGGLHHGESFANAAKRELLEETGYHAPSLTPLGTFWPSPKRQSNRGEVFLAHNCTLIANPTPDDTEDITVTTVPLADNHPLINSGQLAGGFTLASLMLWLNHANHPIWPISHPAQ